MMHKLTNDRRKWGVGALLAGLFLTLVTLGRPYLWLRLPGAVVSLNGKTAAGVSIYSSPEGQLLVWIDEPGGAGAYIVDPSAREIHEPSYESVLDDVPETNHFLVTPRFALIMDDQYRARWKRHFEDDEPTQGAVIQPGHVEFTEQYLLPGSSNYRTRRVRVKL